MRVLVLLALGLACASAKFSACWYMDKNDVPICVADVAGSCPTLQGLGLVRGGPRRIIKDTEIIAMRGRDMLVCSKNVSTDSYEADWEEHFKPGASWLWNYWIIDLVCWLFVVWVVW